MRRALVTGITGQDGSYLAEFLLERGYEVFGLVRRSNTIEHGRIAHIQDDLRLISGDLSDEASLIRAIQEAEPEEIYNLGAHSVPQSSYSQPALVGETTAIGVARLLSAMRTVCGEARFYQASTSEMFGTVTESPQNEETRFRPRSPYGAAKLYGHWITVNARENHGLHASSGILFNHESPRRGLEFVTRKVTHGAAMIALGRQEGLKLGDLEARRDWGYAPDYVEAMWQMLQQDAPDDYVIGTGVTHSVADLCDAAFTRAGLNWRDHVSVDPAFLRPAEAHQLVSDPRKARDQMGWEARTPFAEFIGQMVDVDLTNLTRPNEGRQP